MSNIAIKVEKLSKKYTIGTTNSGSLYQTISNLFNRSQQAEEEFWALKDVSFEVKRGEVLGIIGKNGAGKSTLLKVLSQITEPSAGRIELNGRVASLLEVGTGFHPELTGRENIYLNGSILGMKRNEIKAKFSEIVDFSGVSKFIDTPVKHYSSGMYVRLAFSVAAFLDSDILFIDEVLAVGDYSFQKKCLERLNSLGAEGRTVFFISHDLGAIKRLCSKGILLSNGEIRNIGKTSKIIDDYINENKTNDREQNWDNFQMKSITIKNDRGSEKVILFQEPFEILSTWEFDEEIESRVVSIRIFDTMNRLISVVNTLQKETVTQLSSDGIHTVSCKIITNTFPPGEYYIDIGLYIRPHTTIEVHNRCISFEVANVSLIGQEYNYVGNPLMCLNHSWDIH